MPPPPPNPPTVAATQNMLSAQQTGARAAANAGAGFDNTIKTGPQGLMAPATTASKSLLGQ